MSSVVYITPLGEVDGSKPLPEVQAALDLLAISNVATHRRRQVRIALSILGVLCSIAMVVFALLMPLVTPGTRVALTAAPAVQLVAAFQMAALWKERDLPHLLAQTMRSLDDCGAAQRRFVQLRRLAFMALPGSIATSLIIPLATRVPPIWLFAFLSAFNGVYLFELFFYTLFYRTITSVVQQQLHELRVKVEAGAIDEATLLQRFNVARRLMMYINRRLGPIVAAVAAMLLAGGVILSYDVALRNYEGLLMTLAALFMMVYYFCALLVLYACVGVARASNSLLHAVNRHYGDYLFTQALQRKASGVLAASVSDFGREMEDAGEEDGSSRRFHTRAPVKRGSSSAVRISVTARLLPLAAETFNFMQHNHVVARLVGWAITPAVLTRTTSVLLSTIIFVLRSSALV